MVMIKLGNQVFSMDGYLDANLDIIFDQINHKDNDFVGIVDGFEGVGKSVIAQQVAYRVDPTLTLDRICFTADEFKKAVLGAKKGQAIVYDEAITGAFSREAIQQMNVVLIKMMAQIRQKNLFMLLVLPSFFDLDKNLAIWRSKFLIHCHYGTHFKRGFFKFANLDKKKTIYIEGQKLYKYPRESRYWNFWGRFPKHYTINEKKYRDKKLKSLTESDYEAVSIRKVRGQRDSLVIVLNNHGYSQRDISEFSDLLDEGVTHKQVSNILVKYRNLKSDFLDLKYKRLEDAEDNKKINKKPKRKVKKKVGSG